MALYLVATPIGTLDDGSIRARRVLSEVALICAEDTRTTRKLLSAWEIAAPELIALHAHNEADRAARVAERASSHDVALVSDAGTPAVSDPGRAVVQACIAAGVEVLSVPGPSALPAALAASGLPAAPSTFLGFPPRKGLQGWCVDALGRSETLVMYEAPGRVPKLVRTMAALAPHREGVVCRELSKRFEQTLRAPLPELAERVAGGVRGECVVLVGPGQALVPEVAQAEAGASLKQVAAVLAERWGVKKREAYQALLAAEEALSRP